MRKLIQISLILLVIVSMRVNAQNSCSVFITSNFESQCVLTTEKDDALKENDNLNTTQTISPYLVPNPASTEVNIKGIEKDNIAEILLLDINGKNIKKANATNTLDIKNISKGNYIIRVISIENKVYYLKLIKN
jgi:hypothetical protein